MLVLNPIAREGVSVPACGSCAREVEARYRYCPWCAAPLRLKLVEFFPANALEGEHGMALRVSRYLAEVPEERHVRFSVWSEAGVAEAAVSLDDAEAERLAEFLRASSYDGAVTEPIDVRSLSR
jgi:hypothetical protein